MSPRRPPVVFVVQEDKRDVSSALEWGTIEYIFPWHFEASADPDDAAKHIRAKLALHHYDPTYDWILLIGDPTALFLTGMYATQDVCQLLKWDNQRRVYYEVILGRREPNGKKEKR